MGVWFSTAAMRPPMLQPRSYAARTKDAVSSHCSARAKRYSPGAAKALRLELALPARTAQSLGVTKGEMFNLGDDGWFLSNETPSCKLERKVSVEP